MARVRLRGRRLVAFCDEDLHPGRGQEEYRGADSHRLTAQAVGLHDVVLSPLTVQGAGRRDANRLRGMEAALLCGDLLLPDRVRAR